MCGDDSFEHYVRLDMRLLESAICYLGRSCPIGNMPLTHLAIT